MDEEEEEEEEEESEMAKFDRATTWEREMVDRLSVGEFLAGCRFTL